MYKDSIPLDLLAVELGHEFHVADALRKLCGLPLAVGDQRLERAEGDTRGTPDQYQRLFTVDIFFCLAAMFWDVEIPSVCEIERIPYLQAKFALQKIKGVLEQAGARMEDVVRTRMFVTDITQWQAIGKAHQEAFGNIKPCTTMVQVSRFIDDKYLVEIEATAIISDN